MKIAFLILAHDRPEQVAELAWTLVGAASDGVVLVHYDVRSPAADLARLGAAVAGEPRIRLVQRRVAARWGSFGLVEAPLNALAEIEAAGLDPDYVVLLSGACLPCKPVASLERFLARNAGREFIEVNDASWIGNGWRDERWKYRFWFDHKTQHPAEWLAFHVQRLLGIERRFPEGLVPRFGSQWWALTWDTCRAILLDIRRDPERLRFFRSVWIPDEMLFPTYVNALVHPDEIAGHGVTHVQFSNRGKPVVYHDDHVDYVPSLGGFFVRKVAPGASRLRAACLATAAAPDDGAPLDGIGTRRGDYRIKVAAQTHYPVPGQIFYRDQQADMIETVLARAAGPYVIAVGPPALTRAVIAALPAEGFTRLGEVFAPGEVDLGERDALGGLDRGDAAIRDMHPALFLARLRARAPAVPALAWSPLDQLELLAACLRDPQALVLACLPATGDAALDRRMLALASRRCEGGPVATDVATDPPDSAFAGVTPERVAWARLDDLAGDGEADPLQVLTAALQDAALPGGACLPLTWPLTWSPAGGGLDAEARRARFEAAVAGCRFAACPWFPALVRGVRRVREEGLEAEAGRLLAPLSEATALLAAAQAAPPRPPARVVVAARSAS